MSEEDEPGILFLDLDFYCEIRQQMMRIAGLDSLFRPFFVALDAQCFADWELPAFTRVKRALIL